MQSIGNVWVEKYVIAEEQNVARSIEMYLSRTPAAITPLGLVGNPVLKAWSNGHMLTNAISNVSCLPKLHQISNKLQTSFSACFWPNTDLEAE